MSIVESTATDHRSSFPHLPDADDGDQGNLKDRLTRFIDGYTARQKAIAGGAVFAVLAGLFVVTRMTGSTEFAPLYTNVTPEDGGAIIAELDKQGVPHQISAGGTTILVPADRVHETRMSMSAVELPGDSKVGYGVLDNQGLTTSEFGQRVGFKRAMEGELARTIESLDAVETAVVHLALPAEQVFARDEDKPSASVLIRTKGSGELTEDQVRAVVNLVASGVENLSPDAVTVADSDGNVLSAPGQGVTSPAGGGTRQRQTGDFEAGVETSLQSLLDSVVGRGGARVTVNAVLNFDETNVSRETFEAPEAGPDGEPLRLEESTRGETYAGTDPTTGGVLGPDTPPVAAGGDSDYELEEADVRYAVNRVVESTNEAPGKIERLSVAVAVDEDRVTPRQLQDLTPLLEAGAGIDPERGDVLNVSRTPFDDGAAERAEAEAALEAEEEARAREARQATIRNIVIAVVLLLMALAAFLLYRRAVRRRFDEGLEELLAGEAPAELPPGSPIDEVAAVMDEADVLDLSPAALGTSEEAEGLAAEGVEGDEDGELELVPAELVSESEQDMINRHAAVSDLIEHQPEEVAALLRSWLGDRRAVRR